MKKLKTIKNYEKIFTENIPLIDVRAPIEYSKGSFPNASNLPILEDQEREKVGTCYKEKGHEAAVKLGHELVNEPLKKERINRWKRFIEKNPKGALFCFRGGLRSQNAQQWIYESTGIEYPLVEGGYKSMRNYLIQILENVSQWINPIRIGGQTGVGKTRFLKTLKNYIDLEDLAQHKGSSFGRCIEPQPSQIDFENQLSIALLKQQKKNPKKPIFLEDEAHNIGRVYIPEKAYQAFQNGPLLILNATLEERLSHTIDEYITQASQKYKARLGTEKGFAAWRAEIEASLFRIKKRLGGLRYQQIKFEVEFAMEKYKKTNQPQIHASWIKKLLTQYYDPMYDYHMNKTHNKIACRGDQKELEDYIKNNLS